MDKFEAASLMMVLPLLLIGGSSASARVAGLGVQSQESQEWERVRPIVERCESLKEEEEDGNNSIGHKKDKKETCRTAANLYGAFIRKYSTNTTTEAYVENFVRYGLLLEACGNYAQAEIAYETCAKHPRKNEATYLGLSVSLLIERRLRVVRRKLQTSDRMENRKIDIIQ